MSKDVIPALLTPFVGRDVDEKALRDLVEINISKGVSGFYVCGSTGEAFMLSLELRKKVLEIVADQVQERVKIIAQIGSIGTDLTIELGKHAIAVKGVTGISSIPPFYYKFSEDEILSFYQDLADELGTPLIPYNFPKLSGVTLTPDLMRRLRESKAISGLKFTSENFYDLDLIKRSFPDLPVYNGFDELYLAGLAMGVDGAIGSTFNFMAEKFVKITKLFEDGQIEEARSTQGEANDVIAGLLKVRCFMAAEKYMMDLIGIPFGDPCRPFLPLNDDEKCLLKDVADRYLIKQ